MRDFRYAWRSLARSKGFAAVAVLSLALALGLNTTIFAVLDSFMHPYVPYRAPDRLIRIVSGGDRRERYVTAGERRQFLQDRMQFAEDVAFQQWSRGLVAAGTLGEDMSIADVSSNLFSVLDVPPEFGRTFHEGEQSVVVVSHGFWLRFLGAPRSLAGVSINIDKSSHSVVGVMPPGMSFPFGPEIWRPMNPGIVQARDWGGPGILVRLKDQYSHEAVQADLDAIGAELTAREAVPPELRIRYGFTDLRPNPFELNEFHLALAVCALAILLIACGNLANLMLARGVARRGELALRLAIGANRAILIRQLVAEAVVLAALGGTLGMIAATWGVETARTVFPRIPFLPILAPVLSMSWRFFAFGLVATASTVFLFGFLPALRASDIDLAEPLKSASGTTTGQLRGRYSMLAISQVALGLVVLMAAAVLVRSSHRLANRAFGHEASGLLRASVYLQATSARDLERGYENILESVRRHPGVKRAGSSAFAATDGKIAMSDYESDSLTRIALGGYQTVDSDYLPTFGLGVVDGRAFEPGDRQVAIVNEAAAAALWPGRAVGRMIKMGHPRSPVPWMQVVGVVSNSFSPGANPNLPAQPQVYVTPVSDTAARRTLTIRTESESGLLQVQLAQEIQAAGALPVAPRVYPWLSGVRETQAAVKFVTNIFVFIAVCGLGLATIGLYGVLAYTVTRRMREFAVRIALGADSSDVFRVVLHDGTVMFLAGTAIGAFLAMAAAKGLDDLLYSIPFTDVVALVGSELILCSAAFLACLAPARRAMRADPMQILRAS